MLTVLKKQMHSCIFFFFLVNGRFLIIYFSLANYTYIETDLWTANHSTASISDASDTQDSWSF